MSSSALQEVLKDRDLIENDLNQFSETWKRQYAEGPAEMIDAYCSILLRGGKRLRGILAMQSYYAHGGGSKTVALGAARVLELLHAYLLVIDDVADRSTMRRGGLSAHRLIETRLKNAHAHADIEHYAALQAINTALTAQHMANLELMKLPVERDTLMRALMSLHATTAQTCMGQMEDMYNETINTVFNEKEIESTLTKKTAHYTILGPLELGACLAGGSLCEPLKQFSLALGCAFQILDDVISTFDDEQESGKDKNDDIREGKMTLLRYYAETHADKQDQVILKTAFGSQKADDELCEQVREIMRSTGARIRAEDRVGHYINEANHALDRVDHLPDNFMAFLRELSDYVAKRKS